MSATIPDELHALRGTAKTRPSRAKAETNTSVPFVVGRPKMPRNFSPAEAAEWKRIVKELWKRGTVTRIDGSALEVYCRTFGKWLYFVDVLEPKAQKLAAQLANSLRMYQKEFSATPASRDNARPAAPAKPPAPPAPPEPTPEESFLASIGQNMAERQTVPAPAPRPSRIVESLDDFDVPTVEELS
jgi:phage terminase small subunit